jgi:hypothetical protein
MSKARFFHLGFAAALAVLAALPAPLRAQPADAAQISPQIGPLDGGRGINLEIWQNWWTVTDMLASPDFLRLYPDWRKTLGMADLVHLSDIGFDFARIPFDPAPLLALGAGPAQDALIGQIVDTARMGHAAGLGVIVDLHTFPREGEGWGIDTILTAPALWQDYLALVRKVGAAIADLPAARTAFEPINEPVIDCDEIAQNLPQRWPNMLADLHAAARSAAPDLPLVLSGACWGGAWGLAALPADHISVQDPNVIFSFHDYGPFLYTHQGASWADPPAKAMRALPYPPTALQDADISALAQQAAQNGMTMAQAQAALQDYRQNGASQIYSEIARAVQWADHVGIARTRLFLGEFGAIIPQGAALGSRGPHRAQQRMGRAQFLADKQRAAAQYGIASALWNWRGSGGFGVVGNAQAWPADICRALMLTC